MCTAGFLLILGFQANLPCLGWAFRDFGGFGLNLGVWVGVGSFSWDFGFVSFLFDCFVLLWIGVYSVLLLLFWVLEF